VTFFLIVLARHRIGDDRDVYDTIEARRHAQAQSCTPERWGWGTALDHFGPMTFRTAIWWSLPHAFLATDAHLQVRR
jgi:hypothetical protein